MSSKPARLMKSFVYAANGVRLCVAGERNFRLHLVTAAFVLWLGSRLSLRAVEWAALSLAIGVVLAAELVNTAVEAAVDLVSLEPHPLAKRAKDSAAGAVLVCAAASVGVGVAVLWKPAALAALAHRVLSSPAYLAGIAIAVLLAGWFVFGFSDKTN